MHLSLRPVMLGLLCIIVLALAGCNDATPTPGAATAQPPASTPTPTPQPPASTPTDGPAAPAGVIAARDTFAGRMKLASEDLTIVSYTEAEWPDGCLGLPGPNEFCTMAIMPGYLIVLEADGVRYALRTNLTGSVVRVAPSVEDQPPAGAAAEPPSADETALAWQQETADGCRAAQITPLGVWYGACGGALAAGELNESMERAAQLDELLATYAPFAADTPLGRVTFAGEGMLVATPAEQRMFAEWASQAAREAEMGAANATDGLVLVWHREGGGAGFCDDLSVYATGIAYGSDCSGKLFRGLGSRRLAADELAELYARVDALAPFQETQKDPAAADAMTVSLLFTGRGAAAATDDEKAALNQFASEALLRWADTTPVPGVLAQVELTLYAGPAESYPVLGKVAAGRSVRVTGVTPDGAWWRVLCPDGTLGNCWVTGDSKLAQPDVPVGVTDLDPADETGIYAAVVRQVYTVDHTLDAGAPGLPLVYLLRADDTRTGGGAASVRGMPVIATPVQQSIVAALADLPAQFIWITKLADAPRAEDGSIQDGGAVIILGNIQFQPDGAAQVAASIYIGARAVGGRTYVLEPVDGVWQVTGNTGGQWIS